MRTTKDKLVKKAKIVYSNLMLVYHVFNPTFNLVRVTQDILLLKRDKFFIISSDFLT